MTRFAARSTSRPLRFHISAQPRLQNGSTSACSGTAHIASLSGEETGDIHRRRAQRDQHSPVSAADVMRPPRRASPQPAEPAAKASDLGADAAMRAFHAGLQPPVAAIWTLDHVSLGTREKINHDPKQGKEQNQEHPENSAVHATRFGVASHPHQQRDLQRNHAEPDQNE